MSNLQVLVGRLAVFCRGCRHFLKAQQQMKFVKRIRHKITLSCYILSCWNSLEPIKVTKVTPVCLKIET